MAVELNVGGGKGRRSDVKPSMNVTPLVDVVLVLLIIFMVIAPMMVKQFWLHVPKKEAVTNPEKTLFAIKRLMRQTLHSLLPN